MTEEDYSNSAPIVRTSNGLVRGQLLHGMYGDPYYNFESVPYAAPPLGNLRFKSPQQVASWTGVKDCTQPGAVCLQWDSSGVVTGSEDCLYLSIYVKQLRSSKPLPVLVYVHGGRFKRGDYTRRLWAPDYLMQQPLVVISIGHRLGAFSYLSFADDASLNVPGNAGLKDILQALKWIKLNAANFNGDPANVTLSGHSSGSTSVFCLLASHRSQGLFQRAILQGGFGSHIKKSSDLPYRLAVQHGYKGPQLSKAIFEYICALTPEELVLLYGPDKKEALFGVTFAPLIEPEWSKDAVITNEPILAMRSSWSNNIPLLLGCTSDECLTLSYGRYASDPALYEKLRAEPTILLPEALQQQCSKELQSELAQQLLALHFTQGVPDISRYMEGIACDSYNILYHNMHRLVVSRQRHATQPTYVQRFAYDSTKFSYFRQRATGGVYVPGVGHADELLFLFVKPDFSVKVNKDSNDYQTIRRMVGTWSAFATRGDPNNLEIEPVVWTPIEKQGTYKCLNLDKEVSLTDSAFYKKCLVMDAWFEKAGVPLC